MKRKPELGPERRFPIGMLVASAVLLPVLLVLGAIAYDISQRLDPEEELLKARRAKVEVDLAQVLLAAEAFHRLTGRYPQFIEEVLGVIDSGAVTGVSLLSEFPRDPWGTEYKYRMAGGSPEVRSLGFDGEMGSPDDVIKTSEDLGPITEEKLAAYLDFVRNQNARAPEAWEEAEVSRLVEALEDGDVSAMACLGQMGAQARGALPAILEILRSGDKRERWLGAVALRGMGPVAGTVAREVVAILNDVSETADRRHSAAFALGGMGRWAAKEVVPALAGALKDPGRDVALYAAMALADMGYAAVSALPALTEALGLEDEGVRLFAVCAIGNIGNEAEPAARALTKALEDGDEQVRQAAAEALKKIRSHPEHEQHARR